MRTAIAAFILCLLPGCVGDTPTTVLGNDDPTPTPGQNDTASGEDNTFDHPQPVDVWDLLDRLEEEGPPRYASRVHSCPKMRYQTIGRVLASLGVNVNAGGELTAGRMWREGDQALGAPLYTARQRENLELTTASAARLFDIFVQAAPEIIANSVTAPACGVAIFNADGTCNRDGLTCLLGQPASEAHVSLCQEMVTRASSPEKGKVLAVAAIAAAGHTCE